MKKLTNDSFKLMIQKVILYIKLEQNSCSKSLSMELYVTYYGSIC